jgi:hypothetical protein
MNTGAKRKRENGMGHPAIEKGCSGHNLASVTTNNKKTYDLLPSFLAGIKTNWPDQRICYR